MMRADTSRSGRKRSLAAFGAFLAAASFATAAAVTNTVDVPVHIDGTTNTLDIETAGSRVAGWEPTEADWRQGNPQPIGIAAGEAGSALAPGAETAVLIAVRNAAPRNAALVTVTITDPDPRGTDTDPASGTYLELFDQLRFTVLDGSTTLVSDATADQLRDIAIPGEIAAAGHRTLVVRIRLLDVDNRWQGAATEVAFSFAAVNA